MKPAVVAALAVLCLVGQAEAAEVQAFAFHCQSDQEIDSKIRGAIGAVAQTFAASMLTGKADAVLPVLTDEVRSDGNFVRGLNEVSHYLASTGPFTNLKITRVYYLETFGSGHEQRAICGSLGGDQWVSVNVKPGLLQAHVVLSANTINNGWSINEWLIQKKGAWQVQFFNVNTESMAGYSFRQLFDMARTERRAGHQWSASLLYLTVRSLIQRGPAFQLGFEQTVREDTKDFTIIPELTSTRPTSWVLNGHSYVVQNPGIIGIAKQLGVAVVLPQTDWPGDTAVDQRSRHFITDLRAAHPELSKTFAFFVARALKPDGSGGFGTVYEEGKGF